MAEIGEVGKELQLDQLLTSGCPEAGWEFPEIGTWKTHGFHWKISGIHLQENVIHLEQLQFKQEKCLEPSKNWN